MEPCWERHSRPSCLCNKILAVSSLGCGYMARDANMSWPRIESCFWIFLSGLRHHADLSGGGGGPHFVTHWDLLPHAFSSNRPTDSWSLVFRNPMTQWLQWRSCMHAHQFQARRGESDPFGNSVLKCAPWQIVWLALRVCGSVWGGPVREGSRLQGQMDAAAEALLAHLKPLQDVACLEP